MDFLRGVLNIKIENGSYHFDLKHPDGLIEDLVLNLPGRHNLSNATTALAMVRIRLAKAPIRVIRLAAESASSRRSGAFS